MRQHNQRLGGSTPHRRPIPRVQRGGLASRGHPVILCYRTFVRNFAHRSLLIQPALGGKGTIEPPNNSLARGSLSSTKVSAPHASLRAETRLHTSSYWQTESFRLRIDHR